MNRGQWTVTIAFIVLALIAIVGVANELAGSTPGWFVVVVLIVGFALFMGLLAFRGRK